MKNSYDVIIVGAGPSGSSAAMFLGKAGKNVLLLDRSKFPRDKTCGDGISGKSTRVLRELGLLEGMKTIEAQPMTGVTFSSPDGTVAPIESRNKTKDSPPGYVCRREVFDNFLFENAKKHCKTMEEFMVTNLLRKDGKVVGVVGTDIKTKQDHVFRAPLVLGADGVGGITARELGVFNDREDHVCSAIRGYYDNVEGMIDQIELHFIDGVLPGYFWIFPLPNKTANVGIGMLVKDMKKKKVNLSKLLEDTIQNNPKFKDRFKGSKRISPIKGWSLPLGSERPKPYADGILLLGDAASLIDPFTGEGIGNALISGKIASQVALKAFEKNDFSEKTLSEYDSLIKEECDSELKTSYNLQKMVNHRFLLNFVVHKAAYSSFAKDYLSKTLLDPEKQRSFENPLFYLRLLTS